MSKLIVITGITGVQGSSVADTYLQSPDWRIRGVSRNLSSAAALEWTSKGVEMVKGDLDDIESLKRAFSDADVIFGVTDFWTIFMDPKSQEKKRPDQQILQYCYETELQQAKTLADAAASVPGLSRFIFSSMADANKWSKGKFQQLYHMDSKAQAVYYMQSLPGLRGKFSQVQAPIYFQLPLLWGLPITPKKQDDGTYRMKSIGPGNKRIPFGFVRKDFGPCVKAAAEAEPNLNLFAIGQYLTWEEYLQTWCKSQGVPYGGYDELSYDGLCEVLPGGLGHEFAQNVLFAWEFGYDGSDPSVVLPDKFGLKMTPFEEYCKVTDFKSIL
ncbi:NmrA-like family protein [Exophiala viscosa]|uniref:NmrA-like family protein n=1 Tax=Exophiala viscosa TaxID=2486360 RepID=A0AAN6IA77_9EURO|nr:NmrA-like family protein [Exophiala viscosa]